MSTLTAPVTQATDAITTKMDGLTALVEDRHRASVNHANGIKGTVDSAISSVATSLRGDISKNKKTINDRTAHCCFSENNNNTGRRMCLPPGGWDVHHMGFNDKISWVHCKQGVHAELYSDFFSGRRLNVASGQTFDQNQLHHRHMADTVSTIVIHPNS